MPPLVSCVYGFQLAAVEAWPLPSVTITWLSPVVLLVTLNGTPASRCWVPSATFTSSRPPRSTCYIR